LYHTVSRFFNKDFVKKNCAGILNDDDYLQACSKAEEDAKELYQKEAKDIDRLQKAICPSFSALFLRFHDK